MDNVQDDEYFEDENAEYAKTISDRGGEMLDEDEDYIKKMTSSQLASNDQPIELEDVELGGLLDAKVANAALDKILDDDRQFGQRMDSEDSDYSERKLIAPEAIPNTRDQVMAMIKRQVLPSGEEVKASLIAFDYGLKA